MKPQIHELLTQPQLWKQWLPEVYCLYGVPQNEVHHPEVDTGKHIELCLEQATKLNASDAVKWAVLLHDLGKGLTPAEEYPKHIGHEVAGLPLVKDVCKRFNAEPYLEQLALAVCEYHLLQHQLKVLTSKRIEQFIRDLGFEEDRAFLHSFVVACKCDALGRGGDKSNREYVEGNMLIECVEVLTRTPQCEQYPPKTQQDHLRHNARLNAIRSVRNPSKG